MDPGAAGLDKTTTPAIERPFKICVVFDEDVAGRIAENMIKRVASNFEYNIQSFAFDELNSTGSGATAARNVSDTDILLVAVRDDRALPDHMQFWLGLCLGLREGDQEGLMAVLVVKTAEAADPDSSLLDYLKTVAALGGMAFISQNQNVRRAPAPKDITMAPGHSDGFAL
jgi:hypothetical protein